MAASGAKRTLAIVSWLARQLTSDRPIINTGNGFGFNEPNLAIPTGPRQLFFEADRDKALDGLNPSAPDVTRR
jgi:hypothetical protein